ncbi:unnamed protein product [Microthlaspi erraticum]|uniref:Uncharacterized protein n=1 Tax=Microthlaspi erraticum TaxID=1685480 RepID=A0A6D2JN40_9BRAS|nr:unnamed protein product [Microthlaspi erraticum]
MAIEHDVSRPSLSFRENHVTKDAVGQLLTATPRSAGEYQQQERQRKFHPELGKKAFVNAYPSRRSIVRPLMLLRNPELNTTREADSLRQRCKNLRSHPRLPSVIRGIWI